MPVALPGLPRAGVIDPSLVIADGRPHLLYKTDRIPSSIRLLPLSTSGQHAAGLSVELFRHDGVLENPVLIERPAGWVMLLSQGDFTRCSYRTIWRRSNVDPQLGRGHHRGVLLDQASRLCGPGGADVTPMPHSRRLRVYFHAWTCHGRATPCGPGIHKDKLRRKGAGDPADVCRRPRLGRRQPRSSPASSVARTVCIDPPRSVRRYQGVPLAFPGARGVSSGNALNHMTHLIRWAGALTALASTARPAHARAGLVPGRRCGRRERRAQGSRRAPSTHLGARLRRPERRLRRHEVVRRRHRVPGPRLVA